LKLKEKLNQVMTEAKKKGIVSIDENMETMSRTSEVLPPQMKKDSFFIKYENDVHLSRIIEQNESNFSPQPNSFMVKGSMNSEEKKG